MKKMIHACIFFSLYALSGYAQKAEDLFTSNDVKISWMGVDFSHIKLIGSFSQVQGVGEQSPSQVKNTYFLSWNQLIVNEQKKYNLREMIRKENLFYDIDMIMGINAKTPLEDMESASYNTPDYKIEDIAKFVSGYNTEGKSGIGILFLAESFNKAAEEAFVHFVALNLSTKEILIHQRIKGKPRGFGLRNYWAGAIYSVIKEIRGYYKEWKAQYSKK
ncbi:MAG: hypothetical protein JJE25_00370 [Bacteroidia bacterium]|nr:hypothetical protein [Bacteroidia bacterium]